MLGDMILDGTGTAVRIYSLLPGLDVDSLCALHGHWQAVLSSWLIALIQDRLHSVVITQTPGRIQQVDPPTLDCSTPMV